MGTGAPERLEPSSLSVSGSDSARGQELMERRFGHSEPVVVMLRGPARALERQGAPLAKALRGLDGVRLASPWDAGENAELLRGRSNGSRTALLLADFDRSRQEVIRRVLPRIERILRRGVDRPVQAHLSGYAVVGRSIQESSIEAARKAEMIAAPLLLIVLLLVFRSPVAAGIPLVIGAATVIAGYGLIALFALVIAIDALALVVASMMGLALGVDYALLLVSRFREELASGATVERAAEATTRTAGRTILFAGGTLALAMIVAVLIAPGSLLVSIAGAVVLVSLLAVGMARAVAPALLLVLGHAVNRWMIPLPDSSDRIGGLLTRVLRRPAVAATMVLGVLLLLAAPVSGLATGAPSVGQLPEDDRTRHDYEAIERAIGSGWIAPYAVVVSSRDGPLTTPRRLAALADLQHRVEAIPAVDTAVGPGQLHAATSDLRDAPEQVEEAKRELREGRSGLRRAERGLGRASRGVEELRDGLGRGADGGDRLAWGAGEIDGGLDRVASGLGLTEDGSRRALIALRRVEAGASQFAAGVERHGAGTMRLRGGILEAAAETRQRLEPGIGELATGLERGAEELEKLREPVRIADESVTRALRRLMRMRVGLKDPQYVPTVAAVVRAAAAIRGREPITGKELVPGYRGLDEELDGAVERLREASVDAGRLKRGAQRLVRGMERFARASRRLAKSATRLERGARRLAKGAAQTRERATELPDGLERLRAGAEELSDELDRLRAGADQLGAELRAGQRRSEPLGPGLDELRDGLAGYSRDLGGYEAQLAEMQRRVPHLFDSGYFFLAGIDGARRSDRRQAEMSLAVRGGGQAARMIVIPDDDAPPRAVERLGRRLASQVSQAEEAIAARTGIAGAAAQLADYERATSERLPLLVVALSLVTFVLLVAIFRALWLAAVVVLLNLLTVAAAFGVLTLLFQLLPGHPLGGPGYTDAISAVAIFGVIFGLSIDYEVFLCTRMREGYLRSGDNEEAIRYGLDRTAMVIAGAAAIMISVFAAFGTAEITTIRQFGIGLTVAVLLDATIVRLVLLPAVMRLMGPWTWWMPERLDELLPRLDADAPEVAAPRPRVSD